MSSNTSKNLHMAVSVVGIVKSNDRNNEHKFSPTCLRSSYFAVCLSPFPPIQNSETDKTKGNTSGLNLSKDLEENVVSYLSLYKNPQR